MSRQINYTALFVVMHCLFFTTAFAQQNSDSLMREANKLIYENPEKSIELAKQVYKSPNVSAKEKVSALLCISTAYASKRDYVTAQDYVLKIEQFLPELKDERQKMNILNRIGAQYQDLKIYDKSIEYLNMSLALIEAYPKKDSIQSFLGYNHVVRGFIYREQMNCDIALRYFNKAIEAYSNTHNNHVMHANLSVCQYNKGNCLLSLDQPEDAKISFLKSIEHARDIEAESLIAFAQKGLAEVATTERNYNEAISILENALEISNGVGDLVLNKGIYEGLSNNYLALNDWDKYILYHEKFVMLQNQTKHSERKTINQSLLNLTQTKAREIELLHKKYQPIKLGFIILSIIGTILFIRFIVISEKHLKNLQKKLKA